MTFPTTVRQLTKALKPYGVKRIVSLDFETYFDKNYTLTKLSNTEYVRSPLFKAHSVAIRTQGRTKAYANVEEALALIDWDSSAVLCHHTHFDGLILSHHYGIYPAYNLCTLSMARPLHGGAIPNDLDTVASEYDVGNKLPDILGDTKGIRELSPNLERRLLAYNRQDVDVMWAVFKKFLALEVFSLDEFNLINHTIRAFTAPVLRVNKALARREHAKEVARRHSLVEATGHDETTLRSRDRFARVLEDCGVTPPTKISPRTGKRTFAFAKNDIEFQDLRLHFDPEVRNLVEARLICASSINETRALRLLTHSEGGSLPIYLKYGGAHTLRWSGGDKMNPQNFKARGEGSELRKALVAPPGHVLIIFDSGQIEARKNAWLAKQEDLLDQFRAMDAGDDTQDPYKLMAVRLFNKPYADIEYIERFVGKTCILGFGYQMGVEKAHHTLTSGAQGPPVDCSLEDCVNWVHTYRDASPRIKEQWRFMQEEALPVMGGKVDSELEYGPITFTEGGYVSSNGMFMRYPNLRPGRMGGGGSMGTKAFYENWSYKDHTKIYGGKLTENVIQNLARNVVSSQILSVSDDYRLVLQVHDEGVWCVPRKQADEAFERIEKAFRTPPDWAPDLPVIGEGVISRTYVKP